MKVPKWLLIVLLAVIVILIVQVNCNKPPSPIATKYQDSIVVLNKKISETNRLHDLKTLADKRAMDSMKVVVMLLQGRADRATDSFKVAGKQAVDYKNKYNQAVKDRDTLMIFENCEGMAQKVGEAELRYAVVEKQNDSLKGELVVAESTYQIAVSNCLIDYELLKKQTASRDSLRILENKATLATVKKQKRKTVWAFIKGVFTGALIDEIRHLFMQ